MTKQPTMLARDAYETLRQMYREKFDALEASVQLNENGEMFYTSDRFKQYMKLRKMDQHVRLSENIVKTVGPMKPSKEITAIVNYWKTTDAINAQESNTNRRTEWKMAAQRKTASDSKPLTTVEKTKIYLDQLKEAGGKRSTYNFKPEVAEAIKRLKEARPFESETVIVGEAIIEAAAKLGRKK